jgi:rhamnose transport system ATP-binding protein
MPATSRSSRRSSDAPAVTPPVLTLADIRKSFGGVRALERVSLELPRGAITALIGENGAGKSTLVKILSGIHQPDDGDIRIDGAAVRIASPQAARDLGIGVVHQECQVFDNLSVAENLFIHAQPMRRGMVNWRAIRAHAAAVLKDLDAGFDAELPAGRLSIAQKHVVQIARALTHESRVLILDEPTASLSQRECAELFRIVRKLRDAGSALLFISHKFEEIDALADRYAVFRDGVSVSAGELRDVTRDELIRLMVGRPVEQLFPKVDATPGSELLRVEQLGRAGEYEDVSFSLRRGEILGIYGLVGAGRTELAQTLFGVTRADRGAVHLAADAVGNGIALVPEDRQSQGGILDFSLAANLALTNLDTLAPRGWCSRAREATLANRWIDRLGIKAQGAAQVVRSLSGGNQQKVVIAKWLARAPAVLILDEPTKGIDVGAKAAVHRVTSEFAAAGGGVIMISSELPEILGMSDRVLVMRRGRIRGEFPRGVREEELLRAASDA